MTTVLIVGSGPTGLTLACDLARRGVAVRIIEKTPAFPRSSRAKGPNQRSLEVLDDLGIADRIVAAGRSGIVMRKYWNGQHTGDTDPFAGIITTPDVPFDRTYLIAQWELEAIMRERLAGYGVSVELGVELTGFTQHDGGVTAEIAGGDRIEAAYLVGCDGAHSTVRKLTGSSLTGTTNEEQAMVCGDVDIDGLDREVWHQWFDETGGVMLCPIPNTAASWWFQAGPERDAAGLPVPPSLESFQRLFDRHARMPGITITDATLLSTYRVNVRMVAEYRFGRVFLAGDAAHVHPIAGGLGMNTGIQDAFNLGWKLGMVASGQASDKLLDTYEEERLPVAAHTLDITSGRLRAALESVRTPGGGLEVVVTKDTSNLGVAYGWSSLSHHDGDGVLEAGDRAPDAPCHDAAGAPVRLFEVFAGPHFTVLAFGAAVAIDDERVRTCVIGEGGLVDDGGHARRAYGITGDALVLVRPDNHIALITSTPAEITGYLDALAA
ncbi:FAD-dependent monooxygenase [Pseudonocardia sp. TRM90224]|uniref:FAD-dependent monooxygenase n=1 Tax=Pseudonocardia sp. TRM90224 TaxID=2812678 RepID=UPI001E5E80F9|nr:FAD-dependent monooxygenase [Pseudonocardia sp. TRM90224]